MPVNTTYSPFTGYGAANGGASNGNFQQQQQFHHQNGNGARQQKSAIGSKLQEIDWQKAKLVPGQWTVVSAKAIGEAAKSKLADAAAQQHQQKPMPQHDAEAWRAEHSITVFSPDCPPPLTRFENLTMVPSFIQQKFAAEGFKAPTAIQAQAWPILFANRDIVGIAKTGSGKTLAFVVPAIAHISQQEPLQPGDGPICVVLAPTRELAQQIEAEAKKVLPTTMRCACIYGGSPKGPQVQLLRAGVHILVATPGRLIDLIEIRRLNLMRVTYLVLDEADRMLDMGFEPQVRAICSQIRPERQTLMFSATWPKEIQKLAASFQRDFVRIHVGSTELLANSDVTQRFVLTDEARKFDELKNIMTVYRNRRVLVFCKTKRTADQLEFLLKRAGFEAMAIHGDKEQSQREFILERFRRDTKLCVVATDVASRGLDIKQLEVVINYDFPMQIDDYVHRIGRTGRAGAKGESFTLITKREAQLTASNVRTLVDIVSKAKQEVPEWLLDWSRQQPYSVVKRDRSGLNGHRGSALHYHHATRPSFDPTSDASAGEHHNRQYFGLANPASSVAALNGGAAMPHRQPHQQQQQAAPAPRTGYTRFVDSDDEDAAPVKKARVES